MRDRIRHGLGTLTLLWASAVAAQSGGALVALPGASPVECLTTVGGTTAPVYPNDELGLKREAVVRVRLIFSGPDAAPKATVFHNLGSDAFSAAVLEHAARYRLPCMAAGAAPVVATQEFRFTYDERKVFYGGLRDEPGGTRAVACVTGGERRPEFPRDLNGPPPQGNVVVKLRFTGASDEPTVTVLTDAGSRVLRRLVLDHVRRYRMPCLAPSDKPFEAMQTFFFRLEGDPQYTLRDLTLQQLVDGLDKPEQQRVRFDFSTMACPFEVRLGLYQPFASNSVGEVERSDPNRREFIEWLKGLALKLPDAAARHVVGQSMIVSVPCGMLDLT
jgi:hypothetical protein